jgi:hypothetical protein
MTDGNYCRFAHPEEFDTERMSDEEISGSNQHSVSVSILKYFYPALDIYYVAVVIGLSQ